jgi:hypothetical protein
MIWCGWIARTGKKRSNADRASPIDPDARIARLKHGRTRLAYKPEHALDLDTGAIIAAEWHEADRGDTVSLPVRLCQLSSLLGATFLGCGASRSSSFQNTERGGCPAHIVKAPCSGGNVLAHARPRAEEVPEFVVTAAVSSC